MKSEPDICSRCRLKHDPKTGLAKRPRLSVVVGVEAPISYRYRLKEPDKNTRVAGYYLPYDEPRIGIDTYQSPIGQRQAMVHEITHHLLTLLDPDIPIELEEKICAATELLVEYCDQNPTVRDFIFYPKVES